MAHVVLLTGYVWLFDLLFVIFLEVCVSLFGFLCVFVRMFVCVCLNGCV